MHNRSGNLLAWTLLGLTMLLLIASMFGVDQMLISRFYQPDMSSGDRPGWPLGSVPPWSWLNRYGELPPRILAVFGLGLWITSFVTPRLRDRRRVGLMLVLVMLLGPGLLVGTLKQQWGRPRPRDVVEFGGDQPYREWWQPGGASAGRSFPSGHAAAGFSLAVLAFLPGQRRRVWIDGPLAAGLALGFATGFARMGRGVHFPTDVIASGLCVFATIALVAWIVPDRHGRQHGEDPRSDSGRVSAE